MDAAESGAWPAADGSVGSCNSSCPWSSHQPDRSRTGVTSSSSSEPTAFTARVAASTHRRHSAWSARHASSSSADAGGSGPSVDVSGPAPERSVDASAGLTPRNARTIPFSTPGVRLVPTLPPLPSLLRSACASAASCVALVTTSRHSASVGVDSGGIPVAGGGGWYSNPGDMGRTDVCAAPTW